MDVNLNIEEKEIDYIKEYLDGKVNPVDLQDIAFRIALFKTRESRTHRVKIYNPNCEYKVGDLIYKDYPGRIPVGSKKFIEMESGVVLKVVDVRTRFGIVEIKLKYDGTSEFKKYTNYLDRQKIELLLPHKQAKPCEKAEYLPVDDDPRKQNDPLEPRDFTLLKKKLAIVLNKEPAIALISNKALLKENLKPIDDTVFDKTKEFLSENKKSETTEFFVENFVRVKPDDENFAAYCFALNYRMQKDYKIDFQQTQDVGWGKWNLISVIYYMKKNSPISEENPLLDKIVLSDKKNINQRRKKFEDSLFLDGNARFYLTQREISAGAVRLKPGFYDLGDSIEVEVIDAKQKRTYLVYYYKDVNLMLGFKEVFERYKAPQGTIITFELAEGDENESKLQFYIRTTKKGTIIDRVEYVPEEKAFKVIEEKIASPVFVNKAMFLESAIIKTVYEKINEFRNVDTLNKLIHKVFLEFGIKEKNYEIHILRLFHILDLIYPMDLKLVEEIILSNPEFVPAEKMAGVFYLDSDVVSEIEEEELKRKESEVDENKKKRAELRRKKMEQEQRIKEEIRRKREDRRRKREEEMWEKERLRKEMEEKKLQELKRKKEESQRKAALKASERVRKAKSKGMGKRFEPGPKKEPGKKEVPFKHKPEFPKHKPEFPRKQAEIPVEELTRKKEPPPRWIKKKAGEEESSAKAPKRTEKKLVDESMSEDEIKSQIELEKLKEKMRERKNVKKEAAKKEKIAYKDNGGFSGVFASKLDEIVKKDDAKSKQKQEKT